MGDLKIDDADDGELTDGNEKRIDSKKKEEDYISQRNTVTKPVARSTSKPKENTNDKKYDLKTSDSKKHDLTKPKVEEETEKPFNFQNFLAKPDSNKSSSKSASNTNLSEKSLTSEYTTKQIDFETAKVSRFIFKIFIDRKANFF